MRMDYQKLLFQLLEAVEQHHIAWYDATDNQIPVEPMDQSLWDAASSIREKIGHPVTQEDLKEEILAFVRSTKAYISPRVLESAFAEYPERKVLRAIRTLVEQGDLEFSLNFDLGSRQ